MKNNKGFSLVELIVVIAIMAILAAVAVTSFSIYIKRSQDASDMDYISNVLYRVKLYSLERDVEVQQVIISPVVDGSEDIVLVGRDENGNPIYYSGDEIYETVGDYTMYGDYASDNIIINPNPPVVVPPSEPSHNHVADMEDLIEFKESTCTVQGYDKYDCQDESCDIDIVIPRPYAQHSGQDTAKESNGYKVWQCPTCKNLVIKSVSGNAVVPLPGKTEE